MERSEIQGKVQAIPDSASLHPGYWLYQPHLAFRRSAQSLS